MSLRRRSMAVLWLTVAVFGALFALQPTTAQDAAPDCVGTGSGNYAVPADNPLQDGEGGACDEIWSYGWRNPWRFSFDRTTGDMWIGDVGQGGFEEINWESADSAGGENYGWRCYEGNADYNQSLCGEGAFVFPVLAAPHSEGHCSMIGGFVYRGADYPDLAGQYVATDYCSGWLWLIAPDGNDGWMTETFTDTAIAGFGSYTFGEDAAGEIYLTRGDKVYQLIDSDPGNGELDPDFTEIASGFTRPVGLASTPADAGTLYVVEQSGMIKTLDLTTGEIGSSVYLDIEGRVRDTGNEQGLLGLAFDPEFATNGFLYVNYTHRTQGTRISRFIDAPGEALAPDPTSEDVLLTVPQPFGNHNAGDLKFGPDGMLYVPLGDGGSGGDPDNHAQDTTDLLGAVARIDVSVEPTSIPMSGIESVTGRSWWLFGTALLLTGVAGSLFWIGQKYQAGRSR